MGTERIGRLSATRWRRSRLDRIGGRVARGSGVVSAALWLALAAGGALAAGTSWQELADRVTQLTGGITVDGEPYVRNAESYDPEARVVHDEDASIDYPVQLSEAEWRERLTDMQYYVLREDGTERAFKNPLYDNKRRGVYYSAATGQPLFHSDDKYESGTGWPSFTKPIRPDAVAYVWDRGFFSSRIEVVDSLSGSHLGHVFPDGPEPTGQRYCMNSAALIFVPDGEDPPELMTPER